ncbi:MAG: DUF4268 domain-containing protein [Nodosilinea sp.]
MPKRSAKPKLGRLQQLDPNNYWQTQTDFQQWLAEPETLELLGEALELELTLVEASTSSAGDYSLLETDNETVLLAAYLGRPEPTDLGKLLAWAADADATQVVWVAPSFSAEVSCTLTWLDQTSQVTLLGVAVELWSIGKAAMAVNFMPACGAVDNSEADADALDGEDPDSEDSAEPGGEPEPEPLTKVQQENLDFWGGLCDRMDRQGSLVKPGSPSIESTMGFAIARAGFRLTAILDRDHNSLYTELLLSGTDAQPHFHLLAQERETIADDIGLPLIWDSADDQSCMVASTLGEVNLGDRDRWADYQAWFCDCLERFYEAFYDRIKRLDANSYQPLPHQRTSDLTDALILPVQPRG